MTRGEKMKKLLLVLLTLTACVPPREIPYTQLQAMGGDQLCDISNGIGGYYSGATRQTALSIATARDIDCDPINNACYDLGLKKGSGAFANCVLQHKQLILQEQQLEESRRSNDILEDKIRQDEYERDKYYRERRREEKAQRNEKHSTAPSPAPVISNDDPLGINHLNNVEEMQKINENLSRNLNKL
jgi:hypothetical protein